MKVFMCHCCKKVRPEMGQLPQEIQLWKEPIELCATCYKLLRDFFDSLVVQLEP